MRRLLRQIKRELKTAKHCAIYQEELSRVWPDDGNEREPQIARFAEDHGFRLRFYRDGLCAIFDKAPERENPRSSHQNEFGGSGSGSNRSREPVALSQPARQAKPDEDRRA
jgi:hypothetical protein